MVLIGWLLVGMMLALSLCASTWRLSWSATRVLQRRDAPRRQRAAASTLPNSRRWPLLPADQRAKTGGSAGRAAPQQPALPAAVTRKTNGASRLRRRGRTARCRSVRRNWPTPP